MLKPHGDGLWSLRRVEAENTGRQKEVANPPSVPFMTRNKTMKSHFREQRTEPVICISALRT